MKGSYLFLFALDIESVARVVEVVLVVHPRKRAEDELLPLHFHENSIAAGVNAELVQLAMHVGAELKDRPVLNLDAVALEQSDECVSLFEPLAQGPPVPSFRLF